MNNKEKKGIYIHIPFCKSKCIYCDFISFVKTPEEKISMYIEQLKQEIAMYGKKYGRCLIDTIYFGGGTPSAITASYIEEIYEMLKNTFDLSSLRESTIEVNPGTITKQKIQAYKSIGFNRISLGLQSTHNDLLKTINRVHTYEMFLENYQMIRAEGFDNISLDLIFGLPGQTIEAFNTSLKRVIELNPEHISAYSLTVEESTPLKKRLEEGKLLLPTETKDRKMYELLRRCLLENGYQQYEVSNFSKEGYESKHNRIYWTQRPYFGFGIGAHGYLNEKRYSNVDSLRRYHQCLADNELPVEKENKIDLEEAYFEYVMLRLRLTEGIRFKDINQKFMMDFKKKNGEVLAALEKDALIILEENRFYLSEKGLNVANHVITEILKNDF